ncbi:LacI family DNA-binding transcriptional regulator [Microlunatus antarcticus]|uniref:DNA-binding LacI/PurR family transcriptional regulator n=1 Tax=Microlunatus antarcticus TaxID=53388 RepID=A0A7W5JVN3_9ACTN|nr:DNA-binding LacI/PurR family transcriptional regulator [Microlunatus antarcticus]
MTTTRPAARLEDVARLAGVSAKTVSNVVNDYVHVRPATRTRVQEAIDLLGYRPNVIARNLKNGRSGVIALALPELDAPYFAELAHHVVQAAMERGWTVLVDETGQIQDQALRARERSAVGGIREHLIDGVILNPLALDDADVERYGSVPVVLLGERLGSHLADHVAIDNEAAAAEATRHLIATGRRRIAVIGAQPPPFGHSARLRLRGYRDALAEAGIRYDPALVVTALNWRRQPGADAVRPLLELAEPPDAIFALNDLLALGAIRGLADAGLRVPQDVAVVGFDDIEESRYALPSLTTVAPDKQAIARSAVDHLARRLEHRSVAPEEVLVGHTLQIRESTAV